MDGLLFIYVHQNQTSPTIYVISFMEAINVSLLIIVDICTIFIVYYWLFLINFNFLDINYFCLIES
jgi:hypothetical protein